MHRWLVAGIFALLTQAAAAQTPAPEDALLYIIAPKEGSGSKDRSGCNLGCEIWA